jgi:two-component system, sensor histidine kinase
MKILIADDSDNVVYAMKLALHELGHVAIGASDGAEALEAIEQHHPDVAILDLNMPYVDGYDVARALRARRVGRPHLIAYSGFGSPRDKALAYEAGFDQHVTKPISIDKLAAIVELGRAAA